MDERPASQPHLDPNNLEPPNPLEDASPSTVNPPPHHGDDHRETIFRTPDGDVQFPGPVPPSVDSPDPDLYPASQNPDQHLDGTNPASETLAGTESRSGARTSSVDHSDHAPDHVRNGKQKEGSEPGAEAPSDDVATDGFSPLSHAHTSPTALRPGVRMNNTAPDTRLRQYRRRPADLRPLKSHQSYLGTRLWDRQPAATNAESNAGPERRDNGILSSDDSDDGDDDEDTDGPGLQRSRTAGYIKPRSGRRHRPQHDHRFDVGNDNYRTTGKVKRDGRLAISVNEMTNTGYLAKALGPAVQKLVPLAQPQDDGASHMASESTLSLPPGMAPDAPDRPRLNIVIMVIGSRGDIQPFLKVAQILKDDYGHRVRFATHPAFREIIEKDRGLEFFSVGGDPSELMAFMVKNPGLIPNIDSVRAGDIGKRRAAMAEMFDGFWRACINATDDESDNQNLKMLGDKFPFVADAIIANPPSFAHVHCAEALGIPLHLMFTFPYTPTQCFPHPLAAIKRSNVDPGYTNFMSYPLVEMMVWQGLGDLVNDFRVKTLSLDPVSTLWAPGATYRMHVPFTYLWSPGLVSKPPDWGPEIDVAGFVFLDMASSYQPPKELQDFLNASEEPPVYIGFGSIVVDDVEAFTKMIFKAVELAGVRALVSEGWGGLGGKDVPDNIYMLGNVPHDWLFPRVSACVIHGGAGTTAIALKTARPLCIVPFFGDQNWWGKMVASAGAGPEPIPYKNMSAEKLAEGIKFCLTEEARDAVGKIAASIQKEGDGAENACKSFHKHLSVRAPNSMRCSIFKDRVAAWHPKNSNIKLSPLAADLLVGSGELSWKRLRLLRHYDWTDFEGPGEPVSGVAGSLATTFGDAVGGVVSVPKRMAKTTRKRKTGLKDAQSRDKTQTNAEERSTHSGQHEAAAREDASESTAVNSSASSPRYDATHPAPSNNDAAGEYVGDFTRGFGQTATALARAPADLAMALAQGFHNAPRLYGDDTVRKPDRVTGIKSGLRAARREFSYGVYDGFTGVVRLPVRGAKKNGPVGFVKGTGMGILGFVLKNTAAVIGPFGYTLKGVVKQAERRRNPLHFVRRGRIVQGQREAHQLDEKTLIDRTSEALNNWTLLRELEAEIAKGEQGLAGQLDKLMYDSKAFFADIDVAKKSLSELRAGKRLDEVEGEILGDARRRGSRLSRRDQKSLKRSSASRDSSSRQSHRSPGGSRVTSMDGARLEKTVEEDEEA